MKHSVCYRTAAALLLLGLTCGSSFAQEEKKSTEPQTENSSKEEGNRNVMLNAASANGPREIQIGLPSADVNVLEMAFQSPMPPIHIQSTHFGVPMPA